MAAATPSRKSPDALKREHLAFLERQLGAIGNREDWLRACRDGHGSLMTRTVREVASSDALAGALGSALTPASVRDFFGPLLRDLHVDVVAFLKADETRLGDYVPDAARRAIEALVERPDLIPAPLVRKLFEQQAVQDAIYDTLHEGLTQFNTTVNPFFAEWGLPAFLRRMPIGGGMILASMEALRAEFERRLEPEIRKFLTPFSRRATGQLADVFLAKSSDPKFVDLRKNLVVFLYSQSLAELFERVDERAAGDAGAAVEIILVDLLERDRLVPMVRDAFDSFVDEHGDETVGEWLESIGASGDGLVERWAELSWPLVERALATPFVRESLRRVVETFYDREPAAPDPCAAKGGTSRRASLAPTENDKPETGLG